MNHTTITGLNTLAIPAVPRCWIANSATRIAIDTGITHDVNAGVATSKPSTADSTEIAGVINPSPYSSAVPNTPRVMIAAPERLGGEPGSGITSAVNARIPPSPWLSARITRKRYLIEMTISNDQNTTDATPYAFAAETSSSECSNASRRA